jgi:hypothetical protein
LGISLGQSSQFFKESSVFAPKQPSFGPNEIGHTNYNIDRMTKGSKHSSTSSTYYQRMKQGMKKSFSKELESGFNDKQSRYRNNFVNKNESLSTNPYFKDSSVSL